MIKYKPHYACFRCRKSFKRRLLSDIGGKAFDGKSAKCPECGSLMANMGKDFEAPKKDDVKKWQHLENLYVVGITFHSCGCTGAGFVPRDKEQLKKYFEEILENYHKNLEFFRNRKEPQTKAEKQRELDKYGNFLYSIPIEIREKNEIAKDYWIEKIKSVEEKLRLVEKM